MNDNSRSLIYAGLAVFFWSTIPTAFKVALGELGPGLLLLIASVTSVVVLTVITIVEGSTRDLLRSTRKDILNSSALALLNPFIYYLVLLKAYSLLPAQVAQ
ncbi:MAG: EamA family transporter, partial [Bacteroidales bacterium]